MRIEVNGMGKTKDTTLDMRSIIVASIIEGEDFPLEISETDLEQFAKDVAALCEKNAFDKSRDEFQKNVGVLVSKVVKKYKM